MNRDTNDEAKTMSRAPKRRTKSLAEYGIEPGQVGAFVEKYPLLALAAVVATGYVVGRLVSKL